MSLDRTLAPAQREGGVPGCAIGAEPAPVAPPVARLGRGQPGEEGRRGVRAPQLRPMRGRRLHGNVTPELRRGERLRPRDAGLAPIGDDFVGIGRRVVRVGGS